MTVEDLTPLEREQVQGAFLRLWLMRRTPRGQGRRRSDRDARAARLQRERSIVLQHHATIITSEPPVHVRKQLLPNRRHAALRANASR